MITVIIPAHNEEETISNCLKSLQDQTIPPTNIIVSCDNCTDETYNIASSFNNVTAINTIDNKNLRAGAINYAINNCFEQLEKYVVATDADCVLNKDAIEITIKTMEENNIAGLTSLAGVLDTHPKDIIGKCLLKLQEIEYCVSDTYTIERKNEISNLHGMYQCIRKDVIEELINLRGKMYDDFVAEDLELSKAIKQLGYNIDANLDIKVYTDVPLDISAWWRQRVRWGYGAFEVFKKYGIEEEAIHCIIYLILFLVGSYSILFSFINDFDFNIISIIPLILIQLDCIYRINKYSENKKQLLLFKLLLIPEIIYSILNLLSYFIGFYCFIINKKPKW